jgi:hypothetical protein
LNTSVPCPNAAVQIHFGPACHGLHHLGQRFDGGQRGVQIARAVVGDDHAFGAVLGSLPAVLSHHDALDHERQAGVSRQPVQVRPGGGRIPQVVGPRGSGSRRDRSPRYCGWSPQRTVVLLGQPWAPRRAVGPE